MSFNCIFCKIIEGNAPADILYQNDELIIFKDIKPASKHHFLSVPKKHYDNVNSLTANDIPLLETLANEGKRVLESEGGNLEDILMGFHVPPFNSVSHLHLHIISPASDMSFLSRMIFKPHFMWFSTFDDILEKLKKSKY